MYHFIKGCSSWSILAIPEHIREAFLIAGLLFFMIPFWNHEEQKMEFPEMSSFKWEAVM